MYRIRIYVAVKVQKRWEEMTLKCIAGDMLKSHNGRVHTNGKFDD